MSLIFGRLGQSFVDFGITLQAMGSGNPSPEQVASYLGAAENLKRDTAQLALWLVCIGERSSQFCHRTYCPSLTWSSKAQGHGSPHTSIWLSGPSPVNVMLSASAKTTCAPSFDRTSPTSRLPAVRAKWQHVFKVIHVSRGSLEIRPRMSHPLPDLIQMGTSEKVPCTYYSLSSLTSILTFSS